MTTQSFATELIEQRGEAARRARRAAPTCAPDPSEARRVLQAWAGALS